MRALGWVALLVVGGCAPRVVSVVAGPFRRVGTFSELERANDSVVVRQLKLIKDPAAPGRDSAVFEHHGRTLRVRLLMAVENPPKGETQYAVLEVDGVRGTFEREAVYELATGGPEPQRAAEMHAGIGEDRQVLQDLLSVMDVENEDGVEEADLAILHR